MFYGFCICYCYNFSYNILFQIIRYRLFSFDNYEWSYYCYTFNSCSIVRNSVVLQLQTVSWLPYKAPEENIVQS